MKFLKIFISLGLIALAGASVNASAQTAQCNWSSVYGSTDGYGNSTVYFICRHTSGSVIATRTDVRYPWQQNYTCGTPSIMTGYKKSGLTQGTFYPLMCNDIIVLSTSSISSQKSMSSSTRNVCYSGEYKIIQTSPVSTQAFNPSFCGPQPQCGYTMKVLDPHSYPRIQYTCK